MEIVKYFDKKGVMMMFCSQCGAQIAEGSVFCSKCGGKVTSSVTMAVLPTQEIGTHQHTAEELKEYLSYARTLEVNRQTLITGRNRLQQIIDTLGHRKNIPHPANMAVEGFNSFWAIFGVAFLMFAIFAILTGEDPIGTLIAILLVIGFFNPALLLRLLVAAVAALATSLVICLIKTVIKKMEYNEEYKEYCEKVEEDKKRVALENEQIFALSRQQKLLNTDINNVEAMLEKFYSLDIVKPKYRSLIPIVTMYEYFDNERCYDLTGPNGAYNLYEDELLHKTIIAELHRAVSMLAQIAQNQRALYEAIQESNDYADRMCRQANAMLKTSKAIEHNTAIAAYNSKVAADNATISAYIDVCKW